ncbi:MAG: hypothetical protein AB7V32_01770 [Candidatus Berkiella sp.]
MFAVIYSGKIKAGYEEKYQKYWHIIAEFFVTHCGALGSCLHKTSDGSWLAYSRWPDKATRDAVFLEENRKTLPVEIQNTFQSFSECILEQAPEICLEVIDDLLLQQAE